MPATQTKHFTPAMFAFLKDLAQHNDRAWFKANQDRYERTVREPALAFINDFAIELKKISRHFVADASKSGGSLFRLHRDTRFSKDKSPYKTHTGIHFRHREAKDVHAPGFYLHLEPKGVFAGCGIWHPDGPTLARIRGRIDRQPAAWRRARDDEKFTAAFELAGDSLKRPPRGFDPEHPLLEDLKRKDFMGVAKLTERDVTKAGFLAQFAELCKAGAPLQRFLCKAVEVAY